jgi:hypothetical protein
MALAGLVIAIVAAMISLLSAFAAWRAVRPKPKLEGRVTHGWTFGVDDEYVNLDVSPGGLDEYVSPQLPTEKAGATAVLLHVLLTNASPTPVLLLGYRLRVATESGWRETARSDSTANWPTFYLDDGRFAVTITDNILLDWPPRPISYDAPLIGFLAFTLPGEMNAEDRRRYRISGYELIVSDAFGNTTQLHLNSTANIARFDFDQFRSDLGDLFRYAGATVKPARLPASTALSLIDGSARFEGLWHTLLGMCGKPASKPTKTRTHGEPAVLSPSS